MEFRNYFKGDKLMCYGVKMLAQISDSTHSRVMAKKIPACGMEELLKNSFGERKVRAERDWGEIKIYTFNFKA